LSCKFASVAAFDFNDATLQCGDKNGVDARQFDEEDLKTFPWKLFDNLVPML
jgi:hypothetical protein